MTAAPFTTYPGGKGGEGVYQLIVSLLPRHSIYAAPFFGNDAVFRYKAPATSTSVGIDVSAGVIERWRSVGWPALELVHGCGIAWLEGPGRKLPSDAVVYADPPYMLSTRVKKKIYTNELSDADHARLLAALLALPCRFMVSGYDSSLYRAKLASCNTRRVSVMTRGGHRWEWVWFNFDPAAAELHDTRYFGRDFRDRLRIKRKARRWAGKFVKLQAAERQAVLAELAGVHVGGEASSVGIGAGDVASVKSGVSRGHRQKRR